MASMVHPSRELERQQTGEPERAALPLPPAADPAQFYVRLFMLVCLYAIPVMATLQLEIDYDAWWHLRVGQWIVEHHAVTTTDPFSAHGSATPWVAYSWLFEVLLFGLYQAFGLSGLLVYRAGMALAITAALHRLVARREPRFLQTILLAGCATLAIAMLYKERPWLFTILFSVFTLEAILDLREGRRGWRYSTLPLVFALWANIHVQFVYGLMFLGLACAVPLLDRWRRCEPDNEGAGRFNSSAWRQLVLLSTACFLATFLTPYHIQIYRVILEYATQPGPYRFINELKALEFRELPDWIMLAFAGAAAYSLGRRKQQGYFDAILLAVTTFLAFRMRRDMWIVIVTALYLLSTAPRAIVTSEQRFAWTNRRALLVSLGLALVVLLTSLARQLTNEHIEQEASKLYPVAAAKHVAAHDYAGPLYNDFNWGGYLIWALPQHPVALDGRTNLHGDERLLRFGRVWAGSPTWRDDPDLSAAGIVIAGVEMPLTNSLQLDERFERVYQDDTAAVFVRKAVP